jgi:hypothetical protein
VTAAARARLGLFAAGLLSACSGVDGEAFLTLKGPQFGVDGSTFRPVSAVMEERCGTLDCHGEVARPMRIYGQQGLRMPTEEPPPDYFTGGAATTPEELLANYGAMCGLEPDLLRRVMEKKAPPETLTLVRKARLTEKHKGGAIWFEGDPGDRCLVKWLTTPEGELDTADCILEVQKP